MTALYFLTILYLCKALCTWWHSEINPSVIIMTGESTKQTEEVTSEMYYAFTYICTPWGAELPSAAWNPQAAVIWAKRSAFLIKSLASLAGQQLEAEGMSRPHTDPQRRRQGGLPGPGPSPGIRLSGSRQALHCHPHSTHRDALLEHRHRSGLDLIRSCWVLSSSAQECDCRVEIGGCRENKGVEVNLLPKTVPHSSSCNGLCCGAGNPKEVW